MNERHQHARFQTLNHTEMNLREDAERRNSERLLDILFSSPGVVTGLHVNITGTQLTVSAGAALFRTADGLRGVLVSATRAQAAPTADGTYLVCLRPDALVEREPATIIPPQSGEAGYDPAITTPSTLYRRRLHEAYFDPAALSSNAGRVAQVGLQVVTDGNAGAEWLELARFTIAGGVIQTFNTTPAARTQARLRGTDATVTLPDGAVQEHHLDGDLLTLIRTAAGTVGKLRTSEDILTADGTRPMTGDLDLDGHGLQNLGEDLDLDGHRLLHLGGVTLPDGVDDLGVSVTHLGGYTAQELIDAARTGNTVTPAPSRAETHVFTLNTAVPLDAAHPFPVPLKVTLPDGVPAGTRTPVFTGRGTFTAQSADTLTFDPFVQVSVGAVIAWQRVGNPDAGDGYVIGSVLGVPGADGAFYASVMRVYSEGGQRKVAQSLQRVQPWLNASAVVDSVTLDLAADAPTPDVYALTTQAGALTWGGRAQSVTATGFSEWVRGYRVALVPDRNGAQFAAGTLVVSGTLVVHVQAQTQALTAVF